MVLEGKSRGTSDHLDRIELIEMFVREFGKQRIRVLLGDREFLGPLWIGYLQEQAIPFCFRIKEQNQYLRNKRGHCLKAAEMFRYLRPGQSTSVGERKVGKIRPISVEVSAKKSVKGELLVVMHSAGIEKPCETYGLRWEIECSFRAMKSNGFNVEDTHLKDPERITTLFSVVMIAFCYAYDWGEMQEPAKLKCHGYANFSVFRRGLDALRRALLNVPDFKKDLAHYFQNLKDYPRLYSKSFVP